MKINWNKVLLVGLGFALGGIIEAQTPTIFSAIRVNNTSDLRGAVSNGSGNLNLNDAVDVTGKLTTVASALGGAGFNLPAGTAPTSPVNGDLWTTSGGLFAQINGGTVGPFSAVGTTIPSVVQGDTLFGSGVNTLSALAKDTNATRYMSNTGTSNNPAWAQVNLANGVSGNLGVANLNSGSGATANTLWHGNATWSAVALGADVSGDLPFANLTQIAGLSVLGVTGASITDVAAITAASDFQVLRRSGSAVAFGSVNLASSNAITGNLPVANLNSGTGATSSTFWRGDGTWAAASSAPGGLNTQVQFNDSSAFGGDSGLTYNKTTDALDVGGLGTFGSVTSNGQMIVNNEFNANPSGGTQEFTVQANVTRSDATNFIVDPGGGTDELTVTSGSVAMTGTQTGGSAGGVDMTPLTGEFTVTFETACTTSPTVDFDYYKIGAMVTLTAQAESGFPCTGDSTSFTTTGTPVPAALRPVQSGGVIGHIYDGFTDNSAATAGCAVLTTTGVLAFGIFNGTVCQQAGWTAAANRDQPISRTVITYLTTDP